MKCGRKSTMVQSEVHIHAVSPSICLSFLFGKKEACSYVTYDISIQTQKLCPFIQVWTRKMFSFLTMMTYINRGFLLVVLCVAKIDISGLAYQYYQLHDACLQDHAHFYVFRLNMTTNDMLNSLITIATYVVSILT